MGWWNWRDGAFTGGTEATVPHSQIAGDSCRVEGGPTSKPPPAEETTGVQVDGARLEIYGDFEAQRQPPSPSNTGYAVLATAKQDRFQDTSTREPAGGQRVAEGIL